MKFDKRKPYGDVCGGTTGARYEQDGVLFAADGEPLEGQRVVKTQPFRVKKEDAPAPVAEDTSNQVAAQLEG